MFTDLEIARRRVGRWLVLAAGVVYAASLALPWVRGSVGLLLTSVSRELTLGGFAAAIADKGRYPAFLAVVVFGFTVPAALLLALLPAALSGERAIPRPVAAGLAFWRLRAWSVVACGLALTAGIRASSGNAGTPTLRLRIGAGAFLLALVLAAAAATLLAPAPARRAEPRAAPTPPEPRGTTG